MTYRLLCLTHLENYIVVVVVVVAIAVVVLTHLKYCCFLSSPSSDTSMNNSLTSEGLFISQ